MTMTDNAHRPDRLAEYEARTQDPLDLLALSTLWLVVVPPGDFGHRVTYVVLAFRVALSAVYGIDIAIRSALAPRHVHYALTHPGALISVVVPPVRVIFSFRLVRSVFRRGHLGRFLLAWRSSPRRWHPVSSPRRPAGPGLRRPTKRPAAR